MLFLKQNMLSFILNTVVKFMRFLPEAFQGALGRFLGWLSYYVLRRRRGIALANLEKAYRDELTTSEKKMIAKQSFVSLGLTAAEFFTMPTREGHLSEIVEIRGEQYLREILESKKGAILIVAHLGNWEIGGAVLPEKGIKLNAIARAQDMAETNDLILHIRETMGINVILKKNALKESLRVLKNGEALAMLIDQNSRKNSVVANFFGIPANTVASPAVLSLKTGCPVLPAFLTRKCYNRFLGIIEKPIHPESTGDMEADVQRLTQLYNDMIEKHVRRCPEQWMWCHRRWRVKEKKKKS